MRRVGYWHCPDCAGKQLYVLYEPPWDEHSACCETCGHSFGYVADLVTTIDELGRVVVRSSPRPVLSAEVLAAGMREYREQVALELRRRHGGDHVYRATVDLRRGLAEQDPQLRARLLNSTAPSLLHAKR
jgi:hypothetical protein